jgi:hypothetical protein
MAQVKFITYLVEMVMVVLCWLDACLYDNGDDHGCARLVGCLFV